MRRLFSFLLSAALLLSLAACGPESASSGGETSSQPDSSQQEQQPQAIPFSLAVYPDYSLHPALAENRANLTLSPLLYEPLFWVDGTFTAVPVLCQSYTVSEDSLVWTFTLRSGVTFSDGTPLTAQIAADALNTARGTGSRYASRLSSVTGVEADEEGRLVITLSSPNGSLPLLLDIPIALDTSDRPAGTGPYVLKGSGDSLSLQAREGWWQDKPLPAQSIPLTAVSQSDDLIAAFDSGSIALVDVDLMGTNALGYSGSSETWDYATTDFLYLGFNTRSGPCRTAQVRSALARAIDRESIVQIDYALHAQAASLPVHPASSLYDQELAQSLSYDLEPLVQAGLEGDSLVLLVNSENTAKVSVAQRIASQLQAAGLTVEVERLAFEDFTAALARGDFDLYLGEVVLTADFDLSALLSSSGVLNYGGWQDSQTDALLAAFSAAGEGTRGDAASALYSHLAQEAPIAPICFKNGSVLTQWGRLSGLSPVRGNVFYGLESWTIQ